MKARAFRVFALIAADLKDPGYQVRVIRELRPAIKLPA